MFGKLGAKGLVGAVVLLSGLAVVAYANPVVAAGLALVVVGFVLLLWGVVSNLVASLGLGGMFGQP